MNYNKILIFLLVITTISLILSLKNYFELKTLYCDLNKSIIVEREYIYPILRKIENPMNYGPGSNDVRTKNLNNPLTTEVKYLGHCK